MRELYCDVMHCSDSEFWSSSLKEIKECMDTYLEIKELKEPVGKMQMYED